MAKVKDWQFTERLIYWVIWGIIIGTPLIFGDFSDLKQRHFIINGWIRIIPFFIIFMVHNAYLLPHLLFKNQTKIYFILIVLLILFVNYIFMYNTWINRMIEQLTDFRPMGPPHESGHGPGHMRGHGGRWMRAIFLPYLMYIYSVILSILIVGFNVALKYSSKWMREIEQRKELEKEHLQSKLSALQQQVSPHFFMNTLNNIHALVDYNKEDAKDAIIRLSKMMRYLLYDSAQGKTTLAKEIEFLRSYIDLMKLRISEDIDLNIRFLENPPEIIIAPFFFIPFVENAFKYGISYKDKSYIHMVLEYSRDNIRFNIRNSVHNSSVDKKEYTGIGIENSRNRLDLLYGKNYSLNIYRRENEFEVDLILPISDNK